MIVATIDIGTNTVLLLIAAFDNSGVLTTLAYEQRVPRLGQGVDANKRLQPDSMHRVVDTLQEYVTIMHTFRVDRVVVAATSAVRDAVNRDEFSHMIRSATGFELEVLSGADEALLTYTGAISGVPDLQHATVIDIGGGSTEITTGNRLTIHHSVSLDLGSVRLTERFFRHDPPSNDEIAAARTFVRQSLSTQVPFLLKESTLVGVAGTATSLAVLDQKRETFDISLVTNYRLTTSHVGALLDTLRTLQSSQISRLSSVMNGRSDVITAGTLILQEVMAHFGFKSMIVSERGVRYGLAIREWKRQRENIAGTR